MFSGGKVEPTRLPWACPAIHPANGPFVNFQYLVLHSSTQSIYLCVVKNLQDHKTHRLAVPNDRTMNVENTKAQMRKGVLEYCILSLLAQGELYPSDIIGKLKEAKLIVVEGTLYPLLTRLKDAGLLTYRWEESRSGPPRKYYRLTEAGAGFIPELDQTWSELKEAVHQATRPTR